jgi:hypothetical protein
VNWSRRLVGPLVTVTAALALAGPAWAAGGVSMEESRSLTGGVTGFFFFSANTAERNSVLIRFNPDNQVLVRDSAGLEPSGRCRYPNPLDHTLVNCSGTPGVHYETAQIVLGAGNDRLVVQAAPGLRPRTSISAGPGNDVVFGGPGVDMILGDGGADRLRGGGGSDVVIGEAGNDRLYGGPGNDRLDGNFGNDILFGGTGNDFLLGGPGNDILLTGPGHDSWVGGDGINFVDGRRER